MRIKTVFPHINSLVYIQFDDKKVFSVDFDILKIPGSARKYVVTRDYSFYHDRLNLHYYKMSFDIDELKFIMQPVAIKLAIDFNINFGNCVIKRNDYFVQIELKFFPFRNSLNIGVCESYGHGSTECGGCQYFSVSDFALNDELKDIAIKSRAQWFLDIATSSTDNNLINRRIMERFLTKSGCRNFN